MAEQNQQEEFEGYFKLDESKVEGMQTTEVKPQEPSSSPEKIKSMEQSIQTQSTEQNIQQPQEQVQSQEVQKQEQQSEANELKDLGNEFYKKCQFQEALQQYILGIKHVFDFKRQFVDFKDEKIINELETLKIAYQNNAAQCCVKLEKWLDAIEISDEVLKADSQNVKAMMRKAEAAIELGRFEEAIQILKIANQIEPSNARVRKLYEDATKQRKLLQEKEKEMYGGKLKKQEIQKQTSPQKQSSSKKDDSQSSNKWFKFFTVATGLAATGFFLYSKFKVSK